MKTLTIRDVMNLDPCPSYTLARVEALFCGRFELTLLEILDLDIPAADRIWVMTRPGVLDVDTAQTLTDRVADRAVKTLCLNCGVEVVERWAIKWLDGSDRTVAAARDAVNRIASWSTAAAWAGEAADAAAGGNVRLATLWAGEAAEAAGDYHAERDQQIEDLREILKGKIIENETK